MTRVRTNECVTGDAEGGAGARGDGAVARRGVAWRRLLRQGAMVLCLAVLLSVQGGLLWAAPGGVGGEGGGGAEASSSPAASDGADGEAGAGGEGGAAGDGGSSGGDARAGDDAIGDDAGDDAGDEAGAADVRRQGGSGGATGALAAGPIPAGRLAQKLAIIPIRTAIFETEGMLTQTMIDSLTARSVTRRLAAAEAAGVDAVVFQIDTPGGELGAVLEITEAIKASPLYTIAWIDGEAISGGAVIAIACDEIVASPDMIFGDAGIITMMQDLGDTERAKVASPLIADIVDSAQRNGYDEVLLQGLSVLNVRTWEVRNKRTGQRYFVSESEYRALFGEAPPTGSAPLLGGGATAGPTEDAEQFADRPRAPGEGVLEPQRDDFVPGAEDITPDMRREILRSMEARGTPASRRPDFGAQDPSEYAVVSYVTAGDTFLTVRSAERLRYLGLASAEVSDREELLAFTSTDSKDVIVLERSFAETFVKFMTQTAAGRGLQFLLVIVFLLCMFIELSMPGVGAFGGAALVALGLIVLPNVLLSVTGWLLLSAVLLGVALILVEVFVTPGVGVPGFAGLVLLLLGLVGLIANPAATGAGSEDYAYAGLMVLVAVFAAGVGMYLFSRYTQYVPLANKLVLQDTSPRRDTMLSAMGPEASDAEAPARVGDEGVAHTRLMPAGTAEIDGKLVDAVAERGFIERGEAVKVTSATRYRVTVVRASAEENGGGAVSDAPVAGAADGESPAEPDAGGDANDKGTA